jgi:hypothetical protein
MRITKNETLIPIDVDSTLVFTPSKSDPEDSVYVQVDDILSGQLKMRVNRAMIRLLKEEHHRGSHIIVWSRGGWEWAKNVVTALDLTEYVHDIYSKPKSYFDDKDVSEWLKDRVYLGPDENYKD